MRCSKQYRFFRRCSLWRRFERRCLFPVFAVKLSQLWRSCAYQRLLWKLMITKIKIRVESINSFIEKESWLRGSHIRRDWQFLWGSRKSFGKFFGSFWTSNRNLPLRDVWFLVRTERHHWQIFVRLPIRRLHRHVSRSCSNWCGARARQTGCRDDVHLQVTASNKIKLNIVSCYEKEGALRELTVHDENACFSFSFLEPQQLTSQSSCFSEVDLFASSMEFCSASALLRFCHAFCPWITFTSFLCKLLHHTFL